MILTALYSNVSRYLIKFSQDEIEDLFENTITGSYEVYLRNYIADIKNLNTDTTLDIFAISGSWDMGTGRFNDTPETDNGSSWSFMSYSGSRPWATDHIQPIKLQLHLAQPLNLTKFHRVEELGTQVQSPPILQ